MSRAEHDIKYDDDDDYETEAQARARQLGLPDTVVPLVTASGKPVAFLDVAPAEVIVKYGAFNQAEFFEPLITSGEIHESLRVMLLEYPLFESSSLRSAVRYADMRNDERAHDDKMGTYGPVVVRTRTIIQHPWTEVPYGEIDAVRVR